MNYLDTALSEYYTKVVTWQLVQMQTLTQYASSSRAQSDHEKEHGTPMCSGVGVYRVDEN